MTQKLSVGTKIIVSPHCRYTKAKCGWTSEMDQYVGKVCTVKEIVKFVHGPFDQVILKECGSWAWHPDDLKILVKEKIEKPKVTFDIQELFGV